MHRSAALPVPVGDLLLSDLSWVGRLDILYRPTAPNAGTQWADLALGEMIDDYRGTLKGAHWRLDVTLYWLDRAGANRLQQPFGIPGDETLSLLLRQVLLAARRHGFDVLEQVASNQGPQLLERWHGPALLAAAEPASSLAEVSDFLASRGFRIRWEEAPATVVVERDEALGTAIRAANVALAPLAAALKGAKGVRQSKAIISGEPKVERLTIAPSALRYEQLVGGEALLEPTTVPAAALLGVTGSSRPCVGEMPRYTALRFITADAIHHFFSLSDPASSRALRDLVVHAARWMVGGR